MRQHRLFACVALAVAGCAGASTPPPSPAPPPAAVVPIAAPPPRAKDDESDAWAVGGQRGSAEARPVVKCPSGSRSNGGICVATEVSCPAGSRRVQNTCVGDVTCPQGGVWDGDTCRPAAASTSNGGALPGSIAVDAGGCFLNINSIPASQVLIDGVAAGWTPRVRAPVNVGSHTVVFLTEQAKKSVSVSCAAGETKAVITRFVQGDPGY